MLRLRVGSPKQLWWHKVIKGFNAEEQENHKVFWSGVERCFQKCKKSLTATRPFKTAVRPLFYLFATTGIRGLW